MKKIVFLLYFILCGCCVKDPIDTTVDSVIDAKIFSAKESVKGYAESVNLAYINYLSGNVSGDTLVIVDGENLYLDISSNGDVECSSISINSGSVTMSNCSCLGYVFNFKNGEVYATK